MAKPGRPPKTRAARRKEGGTEGQGTVSHRPLPVAVVVAGRNVPIAPPDDIAPDARGLWLEIVKQLAEAGVIDRIDLPMLRLLCVEFGRSRQAGALIDEPVDPGDLDAIDRRIRENEAVATAYKTQILGAIRVGIDVPPGKVAALAKLEMTITNLSAYRRAYAKVGNLVALGSTGQLTEHPAVEIARASSSLVLRYATEFCLTPTARARMGLAVLEARTLQKELADDLAD